MKLQFFNFLLIFLISNFSIAEDYPEHINILCFHYTNNSVYSEEKQKFAIMNLFKKLEEKTFEIESFEEGELKEIKDFDKKEIKLSWQFELINYFPIGNSDSKELIPYDEGIFKTREFVRKDSIFLDLDIKFAYEFKDKDIYRCKMMGRSSKASISFFLRYIFFGRNKEEFENKKISFKIIGIKEEHKIGYDKFVREILIYAILK